MSAIGESDVLSSIPGYRESIVFFVSRVVFRCGRIYCSGRGGSRRGRRSGQSGCKWRWDWVSERRKSR